MPNIKSAAKRMRTSEKSRQANVATRTRLSSTRRLLTEAISSGDKTKGDELFRKYCSCLDKAVKRGAIPANNASRRKSRAAATLAAI